MNKNTTKLFFLIIFVIFMPYKAYGETINSEKENGIISAIGFTQKFGSKSILDYKVTDSFVYILQVGFIESSGNGKLVRYDAESAQFNYKLISSENKEVVQSDKIITSKDFKELIKSLIKSAPTSPLDISESVAIIHQKDGTIWLFEYVDPLGGRQSIITAANLPEHLTKRDHRPIKKILDQIVAYASNQ